LTHEYIKIRRQIWWLTQLKYVSIYVWFMVNKYDKLSQSIKNN